MLLDLERAELEQQMAALQLHYALLDQLATRLDQQEAMLASDVEVIRMTGKRLYPRLSKGWLLVTNKNKTFYLI